MKQIKSVLWTAALLAPSLSCACAFGLLGLEPAAAQSPGDPVVYLNQAWSQEDRDWYYHFSQGSTVISYDIFLNLEVADSQELFRADANSERYGLITQPANPQSNPDGLPIGISKTVIATPRWKDQETGEFAGLTCAACHEGQLSYKGKRIGIEGGVGNTFDIQSYIRTLDAAMQATLADSTKFDRLATRIAATSGDAKSKLRERFERQAAQVHEYSSRTAASPSPWGPARMDALTLIQNRVTANLTG